MPKLAKTINLKRRGRQVTLTIDGEEFAWYLADEPITTTTQSGEPGTVNLTLIAEHVTIDDSVRTPHAYVQTAVISGDTNGRDRDWTVLCDDHQTQYRSLPYQDQVLATLGAAEHDMSNHPKG